MVTETKGYVLLKGEQGKKVLPKVTIYSSRMCKSVIRHGEGVDGGRDYYNWHVEETDPNNPNNKKGDPNDGTITQHEKAHEVSKTLEEQEKKLTLIQEASKKLEELQAPSPQQSMTQWFDDLEAYIDSLPTMSEDGSIVYTVEYKEDDWYYTGESQEMDPEWNAKIQGAKAKLCAELNNTAQKVTDKMTSTLESLANKTNKVGPIMKIIQTITGFSISLTSIIDWALSVIDFFVQIFKLIKSYFDLIMTVLELVIVRFPQLLNKIMAKITSFDCPVQPKIKSIKINVKDANK